MKKEIILSVALFVSLCCSCFEDDTNTDFKELNKPVLVVNAEDELSFKENFPYEVAQGQTLHLVPYVEYNDMEDLSYEWFIDGKSVSKEKDLKWTCNLTQKTANGTLLIKRNSAGNANVYGFFITIFEPFERGWMVMDRDRESKMVRLHMVNEKLASPLYIYTPYMNVVNGIDVTLPIGIKEFWSPETTSVMGEIFYLDADPKKCFNLGGKSLMLTVPLEREWIGDAVPDEIKLKDVMYCGFVDYLMADDGRLYMRKNGKGYYTARFSELPVKYAGKDLRVSHMALCKHASKMAMVFDKDNGRFLLINTDYDWSPNYLGDNAGTILEFPVNDGLNDWKGYEVIMAKFIKPDPGKTIYSYFCVMKNPAGSYEALEFTVDFNGRTNPKAIITYENVACPANMGPDSKFCILNDPYLGMIKSYVLYTAQDEPNSLYYVERRSKGLGEPKCYKSFEHKIMSLDHGKLGRTNSTIGVGLENGSLMLYNLTKSWTEGNEKSFVTEIPGFGEILDVKFKYGSIANF